MPNIRAVFRDRSGFFHIMGVLNPQEHEIKQVIEFDHIGERIQAKLIKVTPRLALYREYESGLGEQTPQA